MAPSSYDVAIVGSGPIGAATAYFLANTEKKIALLSSEPIADDATHEATYRYAGGSVRWHFADPDIAAATKKTADFLEARAAEGVDLALIKDTYVFVHRGTVTPSLNISGAKLVDYLLSEAEQKGVHRHHNTKLVSYKKEEGGSYTLHTSAGEIKATKILLAMGAALPRFVPEAGFEFEKRQTFILRLAIPPERERFPHLVVPFGNGIVYVFVKNVEGSYKLLFSQEDVIEENDERAPTDYFKELCDSGLTKLMPFLKEASVERILWGFDAKNKELKMHTIDHRLFAATCGSAIRSSIGIGEDLARLLSE